MKPPRFIFILLLGFILIQIVISNTAQRSIAPNQAVPFEVFLDRLSRNEVAEVNVGLRKTLIFRLKDPEHKNITYTTVIPVTGPDGKKYSLTEVLKNRPGVKVKSVTAEPIAGWLIFLIALVLGAGAYHFWRKFSEKSGKTVSDITAGFLGETTFTQTHARQTKPAGAKRVTFKDVAGVDEVVEELREIVEFLKNPEKFHRVGAEMPRGVLLVGPPGCGKTLLAKAIAGEADVAFFSMAGSEFIEVFIGVGASRVRDLFNKAKRAGKALIFIDEIESIGGKRGGLGTGADREHGQALSQLLTEMDGFEGREGIIVLAATNRPDLLDDALLRAGRFDRKIVVNRPDVRGRKAILEIHSKGKPLAKDVNLDVIAKRTPGFAGADLKNLMNEAAMLAARENTHEIRQRHLENAIDKVIMGPERKGFKLTEKELQVTADHEAGHALVGFRQWQADPQNADPPRTVSIIPRGMALGVTVTETQEDRLILTERQLFNTITNIFGGRAAEEIIHGQRSTGAKNDLEKATDIAERMVLEWAMGSHDIPPRIFREGDSPFVSSHPSAHIMKNISDETASRLEQEIAHIVNSCYDRARQIILNDRESLERLSKALRERETLTADEIRQILGEREKAFYSKLIEGIANLISRMFKPITS